MRPSSSEVRSRRSLADTYKVRLEKVEGTLGFAYRAVDKTGGLMVTGVVPGSAVDAWNEASDVEDVVCVGDLITAVNHVRGDGRAMVDELRAQDSVTLALRKTGPRWHVLGSTAECMDRLSDARGHGMKLEPLQPVAVEDDVQEQALPTVAKLQLLMIGLAAAAPNLALVAFLSDMGIGIQVFSLFAHESMNLYGNVIIFCATAFAMGLYVMDWLTWKSTSQRILTALVALYAIAVAGVLKSVYQPAMPLVICMFHLPIFLGVLRCTSLKMVKRSSFYVSVFACTLAVGVATIAGWLLWMNLEAGDGLHRYDDATKESLVRRAKPLYDEQKFTVNGRARSLVYAWDCADGEVRANDFRLDALGDMVVSEHLLTMAEEKARQAACDRVKTVWFLSWICPLVATLCNLVIAAFCLMNGVWLNMADATKVEKALRHFIMSIFVVMLMMYISVTVAGTSMRLTSSLVSFSAAGMLALFIWVYLEIGEKALTTALQNSRMTVTIIALITSNWCRAMVVIGLNLLIPAAFLVELLKQKVRKLRNTSVSDSLLTDEAYKVLSYLLNWKWADILVKVNWLCILYWTMAIGVAKITVVFLSWLNEELSTWPFALVLVAFFWIGFVMFMLPPVPGIPVYITSGIIIAKQGSYMDGVGFWGGTLIAVLLSVTVKLVACTGQYTIGYFLGKSTKIQQVVGVDKIFTRGIESILQVRGFSTGKVAVLVGGPDWPTSVLCGILGLNIPQVLLGTTPVILVSSPCVLAGAFLAGPSDDMTESQRGLWGALANTMLIVSAIGQLTSGVLALYYIQEVVHSSGDELAVDRPEHAKVMQLTISERAYNQAYSEVTDWRRLPRIWKGVVLVSVTLMLLSCFTLTFMDTACFKPFEVQYKVSAPESENGLGASGFWEALQSIILVWGRLATAGFFTGAALHAAFLRYASRQARRHLARKQAAPQAREESESLKSTRASAAHADDEVPCRPTLKLGPRFENADGTNAMQGGKPPLASQALAAEEESVGPDVASYTLTVGDVMYGQMPTRI